MTTPDHIIALARKAGFAYDSRTGRIFASHGGFNWVINEELQRFAALIQEEVEQKEQRGSRSTLEAGDIQLRDYFAAKAMQSYLTHWDMAVSQDDTVAKWSYATADSMLRVRSE